MTIFSRAQFCEECPPNKFGTPLLRLWLRIHYDTVNPAPVSLMDVNDGWTAFHFIDNLTDEKYRLVDSYTGEAVLTEGRTYNNSSTDQTLTTSKGKKRLILARASELPQPAPAGHFLQKFGQSERLFVVGSTSKVGSVPQLMELMNGFTTEVLTSSGLPDIPKTPTTQKSP